jgi:hypothetical protein
MIRGIVGVELPLVAGDILKQVEVYASVEVVES